nr:4Fe-4S binding protein [Bacteriovoracaceae bacterium]
MNTLSFKDYFLSIYDAVTSTVKGMLITFKYVWGHKPVTLEYPEVKEKLPENTRSRLFNDVENCISCTQCAMACPVDCIYIASKPRAKDAPAIKTSNGTAIRLELT